MAGSFTLSAGPSFVAGNARSVSVYRYTSGAAPQLSLLPNVRCLGIDTREGPEPPRARFQYILSDVMAATYGWPSQFEEVWPIDASGPYCVRNDDRLVVADANPDGSLRVLFDGFASIPEVDLSPGSQAATFSATNVAIRCFDYPIGGRTQRSSDLTAIQDVSGDSDLRTDLPTRFNPSDEAIGDRGGFLPNCTPEALDSNPGGAAVGYPVFCDPMLPWGTPANGLYPSYWTVGKAIRYLLSRYNGAEEWAANPDMTTLDAAVYDYAPAPGFDAMDPANPASYTYAPVTIRDYNCAGKPWPRVVSDLLAYAGFHMFWRTTTGAFGDPYTQLVIYRRDEFSTSPVKAAYLSGGGDVSSTTSNLTGVRLARDSAAIVNAFQVESAQRQREISIAILPLYRPTSGDEVPPASAQFSTANWLPSTAVSVRRKYRWYGADELGEGHYGIAEDGSGQWRTDNPCRFLDATGDYAVFPADDDGNPTYTTRYRRGYRRLLSTDSDGRPLRATLQILMPKSANASFPVAPDPVVIAPGFWPQILQSFDVFDVPSGWELLPDRLGIRVTADDPEQWMTGDRIGDGSGPSLGQIRGIGWWANPAAPPGNDLNYGRIPLLVLTVAIDDDFMLQASAGPRFASPTQFARWRTIDARDHFRYTSIDPSSRYYAAMGGDGQDPLVVRDDTDRALAHVNQLRSKHEFPPTAGTLTIPYLTDYYGIGDQVVGISGRGVNLQTNAGLYQGEGPAYPHVVGVSWGFENDRQTTRLVLSDKESDANNAW